MTFWREYHKIRRQEERKLSKVVSLVPQLMAKKRASKKDLAEALGVHPHTASPIGDGLRVPNDLEQWTRLCDFLEAKPEEILIYVNSI